MSDMEEPEQLTAAERGLDSHLELLRAEPPAAPPSLERRVIRRARWQRTIRQPLLTLGHFAEALRDGIRLLLSPPRAR